MNLASLKNQILHQNIQCILLDENGCSIQSDDILVQVPEGTKVLDASEVFMGMSELIHDLNIDEEFKMECIETEYFGRQSMYDFVFRRVQDETKNKRFVLLIYDLAEVYQKVNSFRQERNEAEIYAHELKAAHEKLKHTQIQLVANEKMASVGLLASGMLHEINNPLNYIFNGVELIKRDCNGSTSNQKVVQMLDYIETGATRIQDVVGQLKFFDESGNQKETVVDVHEVIDHSIEVIGHQLSDQLRIEQSFHREPLYLQCSIGKINQVFFNLLINASNFTQGVEDPKVEIRTSLKDGNVLILFKDNGVGIPDNIKDQVFDPFFSTLKQSTGKGLGLSVAKVIVKEFKDELTFESKEGLGTTFCIQLPAAQA